MTPKRYLNWVKVLEWSEINLHELIKIEFTDCPTETYNKIYVDSLTGYEFTPPKFITVIGFFKGVVVENSIKVESLYLDSKNQIKYEGETIVHIDKKATIYKHQYVDLGFLSGNRN